MQLISNFASKQKQRELSFTGLMEILSIEHDCRTAEQLAKDYCLRSSSLDIQKKGMEFLYMGGYYLELSMLIEKNSRSDHPSNRLWATVYKIIVDRKSGKLPPQQVIQLLSDVETDDPELIAIIEITKVACYVDMHMFSALGEYLDNYKASFAQVEDQALLSYLNIRLDIILMYYYLSKNLVILARRSANRILEQQHVSPYIRVAAHVNLGFSYIFDSYVQSMTHMQEALQIAKENNYSKLIDVLKQTNIPFVAAHFKEAGNMTTIDETEQAHLEIAKGNNERAIELLSKQPLDTPFKLYYMGKAKQDRDLLALAASQFLEKRSDYFFSRLPLAELALLK